MDGESEADAPTDKDDVEDAPERGPLRRCIVTRESGPKEAMLRFVLGPDRLLVPDLAAKLPGRGFWLSARTDVLERALSRGGFAKAARGPVQIPPDLRLRIEDGLKSRIRDHLGFARRAGQAVCGWQAVKEWLLAGRVGLLVEAADGSAAERGRLLGRREIPMVTPLPAVELGGIFGREHAVHVALSPGRLAETVAREAARLAGFAPA
ncbi:RNA-binding protein [Roseomonas hellenica]|uniref:RNA-binding protein n=1 Tax=Plastoroseomonas hellenica TaxID=2687306 RepID=A0ABS5F9T4_9PROT|nr:RNA-binding protein [Plastoroseomonas hellenica]MBR0669312.1 RNA-binding protein [Plastoroseomonas hellenica]